MYGSEVTACLYYPKGSWVGLEVLMGGFIPICIGGWGCLGACTAPSVVLAPLPKPTYQGLKPSRQGGGSKASIVLICLMNVN